MGQKGYREAGEFFLESNVTEIVIIRPTTNPFFHFLEPHRLTSEYRAQINFLAVSTDASTAGDLDGLVVERVSRADRERAYDACERSPGLDRAPRPAPIPYFRPVDPCTSAR